ncbi:DUF362 domain-containing protein [Chloroflexota bacterium]
MIFEASDFIFKPPATVSRARRVLIKPSASYPMPYPVTTSYNMLASIITGIRQVSDADIILLEGTSGGGPIRPIYDSLGYNFPRVLELDVKDCTLVEVDNPLPKPLAVPTFWVPNVILSSDFLITVTPLNTSNGRDGLSIVNLLTLLPSSKYHGEAASGWNSLYSLGINKVLTDLYFTLPFDLGIIEARQKFSNSGNFIQDEDNLHNKIFVGEPYDVDRTVSEALGLKPEYLNLIKTAKVELET